jgi:hypothetical protein
MVCRSSDSRFGNSMTRGRAEGFAATRAPRGADEAALARLVPIGVIAVATALLLAACGRKDSKEQAGAPSSPSTAAPVSPAAAPVNPMAPADVQEKQRVALSVAMREGKVPPPPTIQLRGGEPATREVLDAYNARLAQLIVQRRDVPETLDELVRKWPMPALPTPPPGKRIVYDGRNHIIKLYPP